MGWKAGFTVWMAAGLAGVLPAAAQEAPRRVRVGVYDNRAIAIAYAHSPLSPIAQKMRELREAKAAGDTARAKELEAWAKKHQRQLHRQGFGRVPVDDLLALVKDRLPEAARKAGVDIIAWQCDYCPANAEAVDITNELASLFEPSQRALRFLADLGNHPPLDLDEIEQHQDQ
ncbi:MAG: hypothetical protein IT158_07920 [Bryobacterales bacterium]|nr:hypothetical protein [Bryobacterales bacterium]